MPTINPNTRLKKLIREAKQYKSENKKLMTAFNAIKKNKPQKYSTTQRVLYKQGYVKPKKKFKMGKNPLQFTQKGYNFYLKSKKYSKLLK